MGHRHLYNPHYMPETENDQSWNLSEHTYMHTARNGAGGSSSIIYPSDNMSIDGSQYTHCTHAPLTSGFSPLPHNMQIPNYQQNVAGPSDLSMHTYVSPEDYTNQASSSNYNGNPFNEEDLFDISVGNGRVQYKRKSPGINDGAGSSSDLNMINEAWDPTREPNFFHAPWDYHMANANGLMIGGDSSIRNVRSRSTFDMETESSRTNVANNLSREYYTTSRPMDDYLCQSSNHLNQPMMPSAAHDYELNPFLDGSSNPGSSVIIGQQNNNPASRSSHTLVQSVRGVRSNFGQRPGSTFRVSSSNLQLGNTSLTDEGLHLASSSYSSHHRRPSSSRARMSSERYRSLSGVNFHDRTPPQGLMIVDRSGIYGSRNPFDQHRDMRLDIDDMSYEELLALGERIGSVDTGIPEHLFSKCVQESIYCSSDQIQDEVNCVICLEEYANMDDIGMLRVCGHDFHVGCIRKWLSMKNLCPICKAEPMKQ
ncbi:uncharacterized protein [Rutidosis leptorrhynchoides]|uniref:uncharacterized protein n=1 Tax=Rutidosis leptorrhynchoides TaxID=125765 RepID=UPI003A99CBE0